jgi:hypothetical protein
LFHVFSAQGVVERLDVWMIFDFIGSQALFLILGYIPIWFVFGLLTVKFFHTDKPVFIFALFCGPMWLATSHRFIVLPCPHCRAWSHESKHASLGNYLLK